MPDPADLDQARAEIDSLRRQLERERASRQEAELLAEEGMRNLFDRQSELTLLSTIARAANEAVTVEAAYFTTLRTICEYANWPVGHVYIATTPTAARPEPYLLPTVIWYLHEPKKFDPFRRRTEATRFDWGQGLPGRALATHQALIVPDIAAEEGLMRRDAALSCGLTCAYAFPIFAGKQGAAVMEFFTNRPFREKEPIFELTPQISAQLGRLVERQTAEKALRQAQAELERKVTERTKELASTIEKLNQNIDEQRKIQAALQIHDQAINSAANGIVITDALAPDNPIIYCNAAYERLTGYTAAETVGRNCRFLHASQPEQPSLDALRHAIREGRNCQVTLKNFRKNGQLFWNQLTVSPVRSTDGTITHFIGIQEDVTEQIRAQEVLLRAKETTDNANAELARAARLKDEFLAAMSHELRTPLNGILGLTESLQERVYGDLTDRQHSALNTIDESGRHLLALINDILDLSKIEAGKLQLEPNAVDLDSIAQVSLRFIREIAQKKHLKVAYGLNAATPTIEADQRRLKQMLVNLLSNAVKFTPENGSVGLDINEDLAAQTISFTVWDTGIGIAEENIPKLFRPFVQIDSRLSRRYEGTGLGLALVRQLAELHSGSISLETKLGQGSRFTLTLPINYTLKRSRSPGGTRSTSTTRPALPLQKSNTRPPASLSSALAQPKPAAPTATLLLAEDNETNILTFTDFLKTKGYGLVVARDGSEAVAQAQGQKPDLILMDIQMPVMDGLTAIQQIRQIPELATTPIIALTALAMAGDRERILAAGADEYLSKPVSLKALAQAIQTVLTAKSK